MKNKILVIVLVSAAAVGIISYLLFGGRPGESVKAPAGSSFSTKIESNGAEIAVHVALPKTPRYGEGAPVVVSVPTFFTPEKMDFSQHKEFTEIGAIEITLLYPGQSERGGAASGDENDYGGGKSVAALRDVVKFAAGDLKNTDGFTLDELVAVPPLFDNVGLYAFSHPGLAATNVMAEYGDELSVAWFVGRENPTIDTMFSLEIGYYADDNKTPVLNPLYTYPASYSPGDIAMDYSSARYDTTDGRPYFDLNKNSRLDSSDYELGSKTPTMFDKRFYSVELLTAIRDNGLSEANWPSDLATPEEAAALWPEREVTAKYGLFKAKDVSHPHVMLVFSEKDHVLAAPDKPHIHQAYDGFTSAGLWVRLNPDAVYVEALNPVAAGRSSEHDANTEPDDWNDIAAWGYPNKSANHVLVPLAAVAEMVDRQRANDWSANLDNLLFNYDAQN